MRHCIAKTRSGSRCRNEALPKSLYCHIKAHQAYKPEGLHKRLWTLIRLHWIVSVGLVASIVTIVGFILYLRDKRAEATAGSLNAPSLGSVKYLSVGTTRFLVDSPDNVFLRDGDTPVLSLKLSSSKLLVSTSIRNANGELIAELRDNEWKLNRDSIFDRNYTDNALEVRDRQGKVSLQVVHFGDTIHLAGIFRCKNGWATVLGPVKDGAVMDIKPPGKEAQYEITPICEYPSDRHFSSCPGIQSLSAFIRHGEGPAYRLGGSLNICNQPATNETTNNLSAK